MARDFGTIFHSLWGDDHWRDLTINAQHLYMELISHPSLDYAGVADWKPGKLALAADSNAKERYDSALELMGSPARFVILDDDSEEILVRSFLRHDGILKKPNVAVAMTKAYAAIASPTLRGVIVHELVRLKKEYPDWAAWSHATCAEAVGRILKGRAIDPTELSSLDPSVKGSANPSVQGSGKGNESDPSLPQHQHHPQPPSNEGVAPLSRFCAEHPNGTDSKCGACKEARQRWEAFSPPTPTPPRGPVSPASCDHKYVAGWCVRCEQQEPAVAS